MSYRPKNPYSNSKYSVKKRREEYSNKYGSMTKDKKSQHNIWVFLILLVICLIVFLLTDLKTLAKWASH